MSNLRRNILLDNLKGILIFLVVFGHSMELIRDDFITARIIYIFIYLFHMPVFVFISGYFSKNIIKGRNTAVKSLLMIFLFFNTIWNTIALLSGKIDVFSFLIPGWALWYILSMFFWKMMLPDLLKIKRVFILSLIFGVIARLFSDFGTMMSLSRTITFLPFFLAGYFSSDIEIRKIKSDSKVVSIIILIIVGIFAIFLGVSKVIPTELLWADRPYNSFDMGTIPSIISSVVSYIIGFTSIYALINLAPTRECALSKIGRNTFPVYILHTYLVVLLIGASSIIPFYELKLLVAFLGSLVITFILSRDYVCEKFNKFIENLTSMVAKGK